MITHPTTNSTTRRVTAVSTTMAIALALLVTSCSGGSSSGSGSSGGVTPDGLGSGGTAPAASVLTEGTLPRSGEMTGDLPTAPDLTTAATPTAPTSSSTTTTRAEAPPCMAFTLNAALFKSGSADLSPESGAALDELAQRLGGQQGALHIVGFTDPRRTDFVGGNEGLSLARAQAVQGALVDRGVHLAETADVEGRGTRELIDRGTTPEALARNRRVEVTVICPTS